MNQRQLRQQRQEQLEDALKGVSLVTTVQGVEDFSYFDSMRYRKSWESWQRVNAINLVLLVGELYVQGCCKAPFEPGENNLHDGHLMKCAVKAGYSEKAEGSARRTLGYSECVKAIEGLIKHRQAQQQPQSRGMPTSSSAPKSPQSSPSRPPCSVVLTTEERARARREARVKELEDIKLCRELARQEDRKKAKELGLKFTDPEEYERRMEAELEASL